MQLFTSSYSCPVYSWALSASAKPIVEFLACTEKVHRTLLYPSFPTSCSIPWCFKTLPSKARLICDVEIINHMVQRVSRTCFLSSQWLLAVKDIHSVTSVSVLGILVTVSKFAKNSKRMKCCTSPFQTEYLFHLNTSSLVSIIVAVTALRFTPILLWKFLTA